MVFRKRTGMISLYINGGIIYEQYIWYSIKTKVCAICGLRSFTRQSKCETQTQPEIGNISCNSTRMSVTI